MAVSGGNYPDALSVAPLAGKAFVPLYMVPPGETLSSLIAVGGEAVLKHYGDKDPNYSGDYPIAGKNRYSTAVEVAKYFEQHMNIGKVDTVILANGMNYPDALAAAPLVNKRNAVILLTNPIELSRETKQYLRDKKIRNVIIVGGEYAVSGNVQMEIEKQ